MKYLLSVVLLIIALAIATRKHLPALLQGYCYTGRAGPEMNSVFRRLSSLA